MDNDKYKYDIAFSFLKEDENLAIQINDLLQDRSKTFLYSKRQEDIAGTDGEKTFNEVFGKLSRCVVVLYRKKWGTTPWTRIEETAIRNRAFEDGYDFSLFLPLDRTPSVPKYLPKTQIWIGLDRWDIKGAASVIEARVQTLGGTPKEETPTDIAAKIKRDKLYESERASLIGSVKGLEVARLELKNLFDELEDFKKSIEENNDGFSLGFQQKDRNCFVHYGGLTIRFYWQPAYSNTLEDSYLYFALQKPSRNSGILRGLGNGDISRQHH
ncbi:MAG: hypothetical protein PVH88_24045 [Ignavibacteria bacterium]|jgi:hypothetical protein